MKYVIVVILLFSFAISSPYHPFPQHVTYASGTIYPTIFTQQEQDQHVRDFYDYWKQNYLIDAGNDTSGKPLYRIAFGKGSDTTLSEGQGYGMMIAALMAGYDPDAQRLFDGLWRYSRKFPSGINPHLMSWKIKNDEIVEGNDSAFDGDADIAYALILADAQWGSNGSVDYRHEAENVMNAMMDSTIGAESYLPKLGDWVDDNSSKYNQYTPRSSDFILSHFRVFAAASGDARWSSVIYHCQEVIRTIQEKYSSNTGLLPDFIVACDEADQCRPAEKDWLEGEHDGDYYYNAGRIPWRLSLDALLYNDTASKTAVTKMIDWLSADTDGNVTRIKAGYTLDGVAIGDYATTFFLAPFAVGAMFNEKHQAFLNALYRTIYDKKEDYYEDTVNLLCLIAITGNYWDPLPRKNDISNILPVIYFLLSDTK